MTGSSDNSLWQFSLAVYGNKAVERACLRLQDGGGANINLVLFCCWLGCEGYGRLTAAEMQDVLATASHWHKRAIGPLRALRRDLKGDPAPVSADRCEATRQKVLAAELEAERALQALLFESVQHRVRQDKSTQHRTDDSFANINGYFQAAGIAEDEGIQQDVLCIVGAAIPGDRQSSSND